MSEQNSQAQINDDKKQEEIQDKVASNNNQPVINKEPPKGDNNENNNATSSNNSEENTQKKPENEEKAPASRGSLLKNGNGASPKSNKRRGGSINMNPDLIQEIHRNNTSWKKKLKNLVSSKSFDITIIWLVVIYTVLVFILFALDNDENENNDDIQLVIDIVQYIEMTILIIFMMEILLKIIAVGIREYFNDTWQFFDAIVILASIVLLALDFSIDNKQFSTISQVLRGIFRFLRLFLVFRKVNQFKKIALTHSRFAQKTPVEAILEIMNNLKENVDDLKYIQDIDYAIEMISDNRLYEPIIMKGDKDAENWIGTYADPKKENKNKKDVNSLNKLNQNLVIDSTQQNTQNQTQVADTYVHMEIPDQFMKFYEKLDTLDFEIFELHTLSEKIPDLKGKEAGYLLVYLHQRYDIIQKMKIDPQVLFSFANKISGGYLDVHYHNKLHCFDVTQTVHFFMSTCDFMNVVALSPLEICTMYVAATCHDYEQGGLNNVYLINTRDKLAIRYNDKSPLENHHVSQAFFILKEQEGKYNFVQNFSKDDFKRFRDRMISMILATDMQNHFTDIAKLKGRLAAEFDAKEKDKTLCMEAILHAADVSNPIKPFRLYEQWATRVLNEFWDQGDKEREKGLSITHLCDRYTVNKSKSQVGFIDFIVKPYYETLKQFLPKLDAFIVNFETNKEEWKSQQQYWDDQLQILCDERDKQQEEAKEKPSGIKIQK